MSHIFASGGQSIGVSALKKKKIDVLFILVQLKKQKVSAPDLLSLVSFSLVPPAPDAKFQITLWLKVFCFLNAIDLP